MARIDTEIADLEAVLVNFQDYHTEQDFRAYHEDLLRMRYIKNVWDGIQSTPVDENNRTKNPIAVMHQYGGLTCKSFPDGTPMQDIHDWFETTFHLSIKDDLTD